MSLKPLTFDVMSPMLIRERPFMRVEGLLLQGCLWLTWFTEKESGWRVPTKTTASSSV